MKYLISLFLVIIFNGHLKKPAGKKNFDIIIIVTKAGQRTEEHPNCFTFNLTIKLDSATVI